MPSLEHMTWQMAILNRIALQNKRYLNKTFLVFGESQYYNLRQ